MDFVLDYCELSKMDLIFFQFKKVGCDFDLRLSRTDLSRIHGAYFDSGSELEIAGCDGDGVCRTVHGCALGD